MGLSFKFKMERKLWQVSEAEEAQGRAERVNQKIKFILQEVNDADRLVGQGKAADAKRLYVACAEAMNKVMLET